MKCEIIGEMGNEPWTRRGMRVMVGQDRRGGTAGERGREMP